MSEVPFEAGDRVLAKASSGGYYYGSVTEVGSLSSSRSAYLVLRLVNQQRVDFLFVYFNSGPKLNFLMSAAAILAAFFRRS